MQDLLETTHFLTRVKVAPAAQGFFDGGSGEAKRAAELAAKLSVPSLTRAWQMLLKGLFEVRDATRPISACEMALIRLAYAADLPPTDKLVKDLLDTPPAARVPRARAAAARPRRPRLRGAPVGTRLRPCRRARRFRKVRPPPPSARWKTLSRLCEPRSELRVNLEHNVHLVRLEPGLIEIRPTARAPRTLANDLQQQAAQPPPASAGRSPSPARAARPTLAEQKQAAKTARFEARGAGADGARRARPFSGRGNRGGARRRHARRSRPPCPNRRADGRHRLRNRAADPAARQTAGPWARVRRGARRWPCSRSATPCWSRWPTPARGSRRHPDLRGVRQSRYPVALRHLQRSAPRSAYALRGGGCRRSLGAGTGGRVPRPLSCAGRGAVGAGWRDAGTAECGAACWNACRTGMDKAWTK